MAFTDLMLSYRGPGLIGTLMALFVILGFSLLFMFAFDEGFQGGNWSIEKVIAHQATEIENYQAMREDHSRRLEQARVRVSDEKELARMKRESRWQLEKIASLGNAIELGTEVVSRETEVFDAYKDQYRAYVRGRAKGETLAKLETSSGGVYTNVSIRGVTAVGIEIRHDDGFKRIPFEELPEEMKTRFQFDREQKEQALASEINARAELEAAVAMTDRIVDQETEQQRVEEERVRRNNVMRAIGQKEARVGALEDDIHQLNRSIPDENKKTLSRAGVMRGDISNKRREISTLRSQIAALRGSL
ncbi:MAG: hypothetical protein ABIS50_04470 [Luteolibacter sp.]|uniref:hypothetical protein n=1 Tax=Luteolibacter sp. TaxID=1962973 RepID=UPI003264B3E1